MRHRMVVAVLALVGLLLSLYLTLHRLGVIGPIACAGSAACDVVQLGPYGALLGVPVAAYGVAAYLGILGTALAGLQERWLAHPGPTRLVALLSGAGVAFTLYLMYLELFVIRALCAWCLASAVLIAAILGVSLVGMRSGLTPRPPRTSL